MTIKVGDKIPEGKFRVMTAEGPGWKSTDEVFKGKKVALFAVPGAFTGTCHKMHMPSITLNANAIKACAVYSPIPGSSRSVSKEEGKIPLCFSTTDFAASCRNFARRL